MSFSLNSNQTNTHVLEFPDNTHLQTLFGPHHTHLFHLEDRLNLTIGTFGNKIILTGLPQCIEQAKLVFHQLYQRLVLQRTLTIEDIDQEIHISQASSKEQASILPPLPESDIKIITPKKVIYAQTAVQKDYIQALQQYSMVFGIGPAGTGKSYLAMATAVSYLITGKVQRIILTRPAVEAGEHLGFLPGDVKEKVDPYLRPLYDALYEMMPIENITKRMAHNEIEIAPLAFMRGRTLRKAFVILDEAQNTTVAQMKMFLTRLGPGSIMSINGDLTQIDLPSGVESGLKNTVHCLKDITDIKMIYFKEHDSIRHPLVEKILYAYTNSLK